MNVLAVLTVLAALHNLPVSAIPCGENGIKAVEALVTAPLPLAASEVPLASTSPTAPEVSPTAPTPPIAPEVLPVAPEVPPTALEAMSKLIGVELQKLAALCPPDGVAIVHRSTRLCAVCYRETPYHRIEWQFQSTKGCEKHQLPLISRCLACGEKFPLPSEWEEGNCKRCGMKFTSMKKRQIIAKHKKDAPTRQ